MVGEFDFCVIIPTFNRPQMLTELLDNIEREKKNYKVLVVVFDDNSSQKADLTNYNIKKIVMSPNMGKRKYYVLINATFSYIRNVNSKYFIYLPDDVKLIDNFFDETKRIYESIGDPRKICLNILTDCRVNRTNWTNFNSIDYGEYYHTQWNDLCFISERKFFDVLNYSIEKIPENRWSSNPNLSSGVGQQISVRLNKKGHNMYHTKTSMVYHGDHESKMNKIERTKISLLTK
jgi:glycosyltransferase involved in cell wall biosynthesis